jgi:hypothetical protein
MGIVGKIYELLYVLLDIFVASSPWERILMHALCFFLYASDLDWFKTESLWVTEMMDTHSPMLFVKSYLVLLYFLMIYNKCLLIFQLCEVYLSEILPLEALAPFCEVFITKLLTRL